MKSYYTLEPKDSNSNIAIKKIKSLDINWQKGNQDWVVKKGKVGDVNITIYRKGKVLLQGKGIEHFLALIGFTQKKVEVNVIGADESGKGDFFGPLVTAAVLIENDSILSNMDIKDSKTLTDEKIKGLAKEIENHTKVAVSILMPSEYNDKYEKVQNLNTLLANEHISNIKRLINNDVKTVYVDKFANNSGIKKVLNSENKDINIVEETKAESKYFSVACASIIARYYFIKSLEDLSEDIKIKLPKGAYKVETTGKRILKEYGVEGLKHVAKMHFKTIEKIMNVF